MPYDHQHFINYMRQQCVEERFACKGDILLEMDEDLLRWYDGATDLQPYINNRDALAAAFSFKQLKDIYFICIMNRLNDPVEIEKSMKGIWTDFYTDVLDKDYKEGGKE